MGKITDDENFQNFYDFICDVASKRLFERHINCVGKENWTHGKIANSDMNRKERDTMYVTYEDGTTYRYRDIDGDDLEFELIEK